MKNLFKAVITTVQITSLIHILVKYVGNIVQCSGSSMQPTINTGDIVLVEHISILLNNIEKNDIVISKSPQNPNNYVCKRVIGLEGDLLYNNNHISKGYVWLEGDNKTNSLDSRVYGQLPYGLLCSRVIMKIPVNTRYS
ncbi:mitochondrial inner membrane protease subunit 1-like isoform X2 [Gordionus sp. m RMFG-2023]|uniref:mitochondrial inner membrane protease subunit 1-like isoform X2 n=1 Tax=Gordionus sp. m RMFG-2023 TaxID=3053472 RepID=UPI0031FBBCDD